MNINVELFKRYKPENKLAMIEKLSRDELLGVTTPTVLRIIKEAGVGDKTKTRSKFKTIFLRNDAGNNWNSKVNSIYNWKKDEVIISFYIQGDDTDGYDEMSMSSFLSNRTETITCAELTEAFGNGYSHTIHASYDRDARANVIKELLCTYVHNKYGI